VIQASTLARGMRRVNRFRTRGASGAVAVAASLLSLAAISPQASAQDKAPDRYDVAGGCYAIGGEPLRFQATALGRYLLYEPDGQFLASAGNATTSVSAPSRAAEWDASDSLSLTNVASDQVITRSQNAATGCADFPEIGTQASGKPLTGSTPYTETVGLADMHNHVSAYEFIGGRAHCGEPFNAYGVTAALVDCPDHEPNGSAAILENLFYGDPTRTHDTTGWPEFTDWPAYDSLTHEQTYYRWLERAWLGGERLMVNNLVENGFLCRIYPYKQNSCNESDAVRLQAQRMYEMQDYIDAQEGGPGEGWFRIVRNPFQARRQINAGNLAIVLGIEESELFGCIEVRDVPQCTIDDVEAGIKEAKNLGVSSLYPIHKFDNAFGGVRFDGGPVGAVINEGQFGLSQHYWEVEACEGPKADNTIEPATPLPLNAMAGEIAADDHAGVIEAGLALHGERSTSRRAVPVYPPGPHCNVRGLTDLGKKLIDRLIDAKMLIEVDHMSVKARDAVMDIVRKRGYSGVLSGHEWSDKNSYKEILEVGGMVGGRANDVEGFVEDYEKYSPMKSDDFFFGWGYGPDANGLGNLPSPSEDANPVTYPFKTFEGGVTLDQQVSGQRVYDVNTDGTAHYGLIPDWVEDVRLAGGNDIARDMFRGSEAYLQTWERAYGVAPERCKAKRLEITRRGFGAISIRRPAFNVLKKGGQPALREGASYRYCVKGGRGEMLAAFSKRGRTAVVASNAAKHSAGPIEVGDSRKELAEDAGAVGGGLWLERTPPGNRRYLYLVEGNEVSVAGVASRPAGRDAKTLLKQLKPLR